MRIKFKDKEHGPILLALMHDDRAQINIETYVFNFAPRSAARIGRAFDQAVKQQIIEPVGTNRRGFPIYCRTAACANLMS